jgi:hypothetical protein
MRNKTLMIFLTILFIAGSIPVNNSSADSSNLVAELQGMEIVQQYAPSAETSGYFSVWHGTSTQVHPNQSTFIDFYVDSWFDTIKETEIIVWAEHYDTGNSWQLAVMNETLYPYDTYYITFNFTVMFDFPLEGYYDIYVSIIDLTDGHDEFNAFGFEAYEGWFNLWIYQGYEGRVNESLPLSIQIANSFEYMKEVRLDIIVWQYTENDSFSWAYSSEYLFINSSMYGDTWYYTSIIFTEEGYFEIEYQLTDIDSGRTWYNYCYWNIYGYNYVDVKIYQDNYG